MRTQKFYSVRSGGVEGWATRQAFVVDATKFTRRKEPTTSSNQPSTS